ADPQLELPFRWRGLGVPCRIRRPALLYPSLLDPSLLRPREGDPPCRDDRGQRGESPEPQHAGGAFPKRVRAATRPPAHRAPARASASVGRTHRGRVYFRGSCRFARSFPSWCSCWLALSPRMGSPAPVWGHSRTSAAPVRTATSDTTSAYPLRMAPAATTTTRAPPARAVREARVPGEPGFPTASSATRTTTASTMTRAPTTSATSASASTTPAATGTRATTATRARWATAAATAAAPASRWCVTTARGAR